jgi:hypothetical protein
VTSFEMFVDEIKSSRRTVNRQVAGSLRLLPTAILAITCDSGPDSWFQGN